MFMRFFILYYTLAAAMGPFLCCCAIRAEAVEPVVEQVRNHTHCHHSHEGSPCHRVPKPSGPAGSFDDEPHQCPCDHGEEPVANDAQVIAAPAVEPAVTGGIAAALLTFSADVSQLNCSTQSGGDHITLLTGRDILRAYSILRC